MLTARLSGARVVIADFLQWWESELRAAFDEAWAKLSERRGGQGVLRVSGDQLTLYRRQQGRQIELARHLFSGDIDAIPDAITALLTNRNDVLAGLEVELPPDAVLSRRVPLPAAVGRRIRETLGFQLERLMPLRATHVYYDTALISRDTERGKILTELSIARRGQVDRIADAALACGVRKVSVTAGATGDDSPRKHFLTRSIEKQSAAAQRVDRWLIYSAVALVFIVAGAAALKYHLANQRLQTEVAALRVKAAHADQIRQSLDERVAQIKLLSARMQTVDQATVLAELTGLLPDDAWIFQFQQDGDGIELAGFAKNASALTERLRTSTAFKDVALRSATKSPNADLERFDIVLHLVATNP